MAFDRHVYCTVQWSIVWNGRQPAHVFSVPRFSKIRSIFGLVGRASSASATPGPKPPNKGRGRTFMDVPSAPTKSGNERLTHLKALGFYFGLHVLTRIDPNPAHGSNYYRTSIPYSSHHTARMKHAHAPPVCTRGGSLARARWTPAAGPG